MNEYLTIGELADIFHMNVQLLRHYDSIGILVPAIRNEKNGRRLYHFDQVYPLATIRFLRKLGYPLAQIGEFARSQDVNRNLDMLIERAAELRQQCNELMDTIDIIQKKLDFVEHEKAHFQKGSFQLKTYPDRKCIYIGEELNLFTHELLYFFPTVGFYQESGKQFGAYLFNEDEQSDKLIEGSENVTILGGTYLCGYHYGPYQTIYDSIDRLKEAARGHQVDPCVITLNIIDQFVESNPQSYVTALELRLLD